MKCKTPSLVRSAEAHMRGRTEPVSLARNHANDVAAAQFRLDAGDLAFGIS